MTSLPGEGRWAVRGNRLSLADASSTLVVARHGAIRSALGRPSSSPAPRRFVNETDLARATRWLALGSTPSRPRLSVANWCSIRQASNFLVKRCRRYPDVAHGFADQEAPQAHAEEEAQEDA